MYITNYYHHYYCNILICTNCHPYYYIQIYATTTALDNIDREKLQALFDDYDVDKDGVISLNEVEKMLVTLGVAPLKEISKLSSASSDKAPKEPAN